MTTMRTIEMFDAIDPGAAKPHAVAHFENGQLTGRRFCTGGMRVDPLGTLRAVVEVPGASYRNATTHRALTMAAMRAVARYEHVVELPANGSGAWKQGRKRQHQRLIWAALTCDEQELLAKFFETSVSWLHDRVNSDRPLHNVSDMLDAVGLGLYYLARIDCAGRRAV